MERILIGPESDPSSEILVQPGALETVDPGTFLPRASRASRVAILTQPGPASSYARKVRRALASAGYRADVRILPDREAAKTLATCEECFLWLNELALTRDDVILGVGGGSVTDVAGFVAATYLRGIDVVHVPTTLLAAVDAAIGGKTGVNVGGKNLVGVFHHPARVVVDPHVLAGLPDDLVVEGTAEALKAGLVADPEIVLLYEEFGIDAPIEDVVIRAIRVKADVVSEDFREQGRRGILNYGHTVGHAIETASGLPHGHAVAVGMVAAGAASEAVTGFGEAQRQRDLIAALGLPVAAADVTESAVLAFMALDKKRRGDDLRMTLLEEIGRAVVVAVDDATVRRALEAIGVRSA